MEAHEICETWPEIPLDQFKKMVTSIRTSGLIQSITTFEGKILDGRHRYRACIEAGVSPRFEQYKGDDPVGFSQAANDHRRHATPSQRAIQAIKLLDYEKRMAKGRMAAGGGDKRSGDAFGRHPLAGHESKGNGPKRRDPDRPLKDDPGGRAANKLAAKVGVSPRNITRALTVRRDGTPKLNAAVANGEIKLTEAERIARLNAATQDKVVETPKRERSAAILEAAHRKEACRRRAAKKKNPPVSREIGTPFVRKFLHAIERTALVCAEDGACDARAIATKFLEEMDWNQDVLRLQYERGQPVIRALALIEQRRVAKAA